MEVEDQTLEEVSVVYATFWMRMLAHNIDLLILIIPLLIARQFDIDQTLLYALAAIGYGAYHIGFELSAWNGSPGKRIVGIEILDGTYQKASPTSTILRTLLKSISLLIVFGGFTMINFTRRKQGLHDLLSGCIVTVKSRGRKM